MPVRRLLRLSLVLAIAALVAAASVPALAAPAGQESLTDVIDLNILSAGFGGSFRENRWVPLLISVTNSGDPLSGQIIVRPETSGAGVTSTFSTPIDLPTGARKITPLYIQVLSFVGQVQVEVLNDQGFIVARKSVRLRPVQPLDQIYAYVTRPESLSLDLTSLTTGDHSAAQATWTVGMIPDRAPALAALDMMMISDADTDVLTPDQRQAIADWVAGGGYLIVTGGPNWQGTAAGLTDLLPFTPDGAAPLTDFSALAAAAGDYSTTLTGDSTIATGAVHVGSTVFAATADGTPLVIRRSYGSGTVDYFAADPLLEPLRSWQGLGDLWLSMLYTRPPAPSWIQGFFDWDQANDAVSVLPGLNLLPDVLSLVAFLVIYILLIGPVNFLILNLIHKREWAWVTIPALIVVFTVLAWTVGFNLRGNVVTLSRLSVVQTWPEVESAQVNQMIGLLSPRRNTYTMTLDDSRFMQVAPRGTSGGVFGATTSNIDIHQTDVFNAENFSVDGGIFADFATRGTVPKPAITGRLTMSYDLATGGQTLQGSVRNDSDLTLTDPVILARGMVYALPGPLRPGDLQTFDSSELVMNPGDLNSPPIPAPAAMEHTFGLASYSLFSALSYFEADSRVQSVMDIIGTQSYRTGRSVTDVFGASTEEQTMRRRQAFLSSFIFDQYGSTSRGNRVYLVGWTDNAPAPLAEEVSGVDFTHIDTSLYIVELSTTIEHPLDTQTVTINPDQFTWVTRDRNGLAEGGPINTRLDPGQVLVVQYMPLPASELAVVDGLRFYARISSGYNSLVRVNLWDWDAGEWTQIDTPAQNERYVDISRPERFIGPHNMVRAQISLASDLGSVNLREMMIDQTGHF